MSPPDLPDLSGVAILIVDDNDDALELLGSFLRACRADVLLARNASAALAYADTRPNIDVLVTDLSMPSMDGVQLVQQLRQRYPLRSLPAIALTGFYEEYEATHAATFNAFLKKPVNFDELCRTIRSVVDPT